MIEGRRYSIGRHHTIEERHRNMLEGRRYSIGRHHTIEERHRNMVEMRYYSIGRHYSVRDWCRNVVKSKRMRGVYPRSLDYSQHHPQMNCGLIDQIREFHRE